MKSTGWSHLLLGTVLATVPLGGALGQSAGLPAVVTEAARSASEHSTSDMTIDPAALIAMIEAARAADTVAEAEVDRIMTGSIFPVVAGPRTGGLSEIAPPRGSGLSEPKTAPEPVAAPAPKAPAATAAAPTKVSMASPSEETMKPTPAPIGAAPASAPTIAIEGAAPATPSEPVNAGDGAKVESSVLPVDAPEAVTPAAGPSATAEPSAPTAETIDKPQAAAETAAKPEAADAPASASVPAPAAAEATPPVKPASEAAVVPQVQSAPAPVAAAPAPLAVTPAPEVAAAPAAAAPAEAPVAVAPAAQIPAAPVAAAPATPAPAVVPPAVMASKAPDLALVPAQAMIAPAKAAQPASPQPTITATTPAPAAVVAAPTASPVVTTPAPSTDAAIAATIAAEKAAAALKAALEEIQPLAGAAEERADRAALLAFYADRAFLPLFVDAQGTTDRARAAMGALARAGEDGLEARDYVLPRVEAGLSPEARAKAEITHAATVVRFARHLQSGRFDPGRVHELVTPTPPKTEAREVLERVAGSTSVAATLAAHAPPHEGYRRLKAMLADLRRAAPDAPMVMLPVGPTLKPGQKDARVALLRERLGVGSVVSDGEIYDPSLAEAVKAFQRERGLTPSGAVGRETVSALNGEKTGTGARIADMISNMERWRWLPRELGELHVYVNTADFHLDVMKDGRSIHHARVVVGKPSNPTPVFSDQMRHVVVNPYWNVPYSIVKKEMMGRLQASAGQSLGRSYEVRVGNQMVDPTTVDWTTVNAAKVSIRQRPGDGNALGHIKFLFPNRHAVYLHDTSSRSLFSQSYRALSHGCVRVHEPFSFADAVLSEEPEKVDGARLKKMIGGGEKTINLQRLVPVHITYFTAFVDDAGQLQTRPDIYGHDGRVKHLLGL